MERVLSGDLIKKGLRPLIFDIGNWKFGKTSSKGIPTIIISNF